MGDFKLKLNLQKYHMEEVVVGENTWITLPTSDEELNKVITELCPTKYDNFRIRKQKNSIGLIVVDVTQDLYDINKQLIRLNNYIDEDELSALISVTRIHDIDSLLGIKLAGKYHYFKNKTLADIEELVNVLWNNSNEAELELIFDIPVCEIYEFLKNSTFADLLKKSGYVETPTGVIKY